MQYPYLTRWGVPVKVQEVFAGSITTDNIGNLFFKYAPDQLEHYGLAFHYVPASYTFWKGGCLDLNLANEIFICSSAMEAIAFLTFNHHRFSSLDNLLFLAVGTSYTKYHTGWLKEHLPGKKYSLIFPNDLIGHITDLKIALATHNKTARVTLEEGRVKVNYRLTDVFFPEDTFTLNAFCKAMLFASGKTLPRTYKSKTHTSFLNQLNTAHLF